MLKPNFVAWLKDPRTFFTRYPLAGNAKATAILAAIAFLVGQAPLALGMSKSPPTSAECSGEPMYITEGCVDPRFSSPVIEVNEERKEPVPHRYVTGHFENTDARFSFYFPLDNYQGRFFQYTHQLIVSENAGEEYVSFALSNGAYLVQTNMGGKDAVRTATAGPIQGLDPSVSGYRVNAAAAKFSRSVAQDVYHEHRPYGYISGGSGGAYQIYASMQNTSVWDGGVPFIMGTWVATPNVFTVRIHALRILRDGGVNKFPEILDAIAPGGSGDPYASLNQEQREALEEATKLGFPMRGWFDYKSLNVGPLRLVAEYVSLIDPEYFNDYWNVEGYLGHDDPYGSVAKAVVGGHTEVSFIQPAPNQNKRLAVPPMWVVGFKQPPVGQLAGATMAINTGAAAGSQLSVLSQAMPGTFVLYGDGSKLKPGDNVSFSNRDYLALQTYHRHQVPDMARYAKHSAPHPYLPDELPQHFPHMAAWDQFVDSKGKPIYPQRKMLVGLASTFYGAGSVPNGEFHGKMIGVQTMMDIDAFPWQADWYKRLIEKAGNSDRYRLNYIDHADHGMDVTGKPGVSSKERQAHLVSFRGALEQTMLDLAAWVEKGVEPPKQSQYTLDGAQVVLKASAAERAGIQPLVRLEAGGGARAEVKTGDQVSFTGYIDVPPNTGTIVQVEWDFLGTGDFIPAELSEIKPGDITVKANHRYTRPGTYFPVLRVAQHRAGDTEDAHARVQNLGRARVVVK